MPLFSLSWNIIGIGFILAMNFFAVDYALHLLGFSKQKEAHTVTVSAKASNNSVSSIEFRINKKTVKGIRSSQLPPFSSFFCRFSPLKETIYEKDRSVDPTRHIHLACCAHRAPPANV